MPYIITTEHDLPSAEDSSVLPYRTSQVFATLKEARQVAGAAAYTWTVYGQRPEIASAIQTMPESGGTVTFPNGTVITVEPVTWEALATIAGSNATSDSGLLDAYNAR